MRPFPAIVLLGGAGCLAFESGSPVILFADLGVPQATLSNVSFSINAFQGFNEQVAGTPGSPAYKAHVGAMLAGRGVVRYHNEGMMTGPNGGSATWLNVDTKNPDPIAAVTWNATKVAAALADTLWDGTGSQAMICLSAFPALWADANASKVLNASFANAWVSLAAELQAIIARLGVRIDYWEITNEWDQAYAAVGNTSGLADLVLATAAVLRAADPTVKVGGPAWARPDIWQNASPFIQATLGKLDFYSYHSYSTGSTTAPNASIYDAVYTGGIERQIRAYISWYTNDTEVINSTPLFHDENNISWDPPDVRMTNVVGAIYDALFIASTLGNGGTLAARWNEADGWYGACNNDANWTSRPAAFVWQLANTFLWGNVTASASSPVSSQVAVFVTLDPAATAWRTQHGRALWSAVTGSVPPPSSTPTGLCVFVIINYSGAAQTAMLQVSGWPAGPPAANTPVALFTVSEDGLSSANTTFGAMLGAVAVPQDTVQFFIVPVAQMALKE